MNQFMLLAGISLPIFIVLDLLWLGVVAKSFYQSKLAHLVGPVMWPAAILFYAVFVAGLTYFATCPATSHSNLREAVYLGALFGFFTYATYDLTNQATLRSWPLSVTVVDIVWGTILGATVSLVATLVYTYTMK
jgi:uncharacterized membrane protein